MVRNELVYENDFESLDLNSIDGGDIMSFNNTNVIGDFTMMDLPFFGRYRRS